MLFVGSFGMIASNDNSQLQTCRVGCTGPVIVVGVVEDDDGDDNSDNSIIPPTVFHLVRSESIDCLLLRRRPVQFR